MRRRTPRKILFLLAVLALLLFPASALETGEPGNFASLPPEPVAAPLNPQFLAAQELHQETPLIVGNSTYTTGAFPSPVDLSHLAGIDISSRIYASAGQSDESSAGPEGYPPMVGVPSLYDLRLLGRVTPVRDQGNCGSAWAFASYGSLESVLMPSERWDFSENNLKNRHGFDRDHCSGGSAWMAAAYLTRWSGPVAESDDPYNPNSGSSPAGLSVRKHVQEILFLPPRQSVYDLYNFKAAIQSYGGVYSTLYWDNSYYNSGKRAYRYTGTSAANFAVTLVGWDDNFDRNRFIPAATQNGAFIAKNSWGTGFGESGYFYISYDDSQIGKESAVFLDSSYPDYMRNLQYDPLGWTYSWGYGTDTAFFANVFSSGADEQLSAVGFYTAAVDSKYDISVYLDPVSGPLNPTGPVYLFSGTSPLPGFHTVRLPTPVPLEPGKKFSVVVKLRTPGYSYPIATEQPLSGYSGKAEASPGQSYISPNGNTWTDLTSKAANANVCLKAYTTRLPPNPMPAITMIDPPYVTAGSPGISLTISGIEFVPGSRVRWNGADRSTTYLSPTKLKVQIPASDFSTAGTTRVTVYNPPPGGGTSSAVTFTIENPVPAISGIDPTSVTAGECGFSLTVTGSDFVTGSKVKWNGADRITTYRSPTTLVAEVPASDISTAGTGGVSVYNPPPGGGESDTQTITINNPVPALTAIDPTSVKAGSDGFTLTVTGAGIVSGSTVRWNGADRSTNIRSSTELTADIPAGDIATPGTATITVANTGPGGGVSSGLSLEILPVIQKPVADFTVDRTSGVAPLTVTFQDNSTGESIDNWTWAFGDGDFSTDQNPVHVYENPGDYTVSLTVSNPGGSDIATKTSFISASEPPWIRLEDHAPRYRSGEEVTFTAVTNLPAGEPVIMDVISRPSPITEPLDMTGVQEFSGTAGVPSVTQSGERNITSLTVNTGQLLTDDSPYTYLVRAESPVAGISAESQFLLTMSEPDAAFGADTVAGIGPVTVRFTDTSENSPKSWLWDFGDGTTSTKENPVHTYEPITPRTYSASRVGDATDSTGIFRNYTVTLTVTNAKGSSTARKWDRITVVSATIPVSEDTSIDSPLLRDEDPNGTPPVQSVRGENLGASAVLTVMQGQGAANEFNGSQLSLVRFDLPPVPEYLIDNATLHLYHTGGIGQDIAVHRMKTGWDETEATFSAPAADAPSWEAGWVSGENYEVQPTDVVRVSDPDRWYDWDVTEDVKAFLDGTPNHGCAVMPGDLFSKPELNGTTFASREAGDEVRGYLRIRMMDKNAELIRSDEGVDEISNHVPLVRFGSSPHEDIIYYGANATNFPEKEVARDNAMRPDEWFYLPGGHQINHYFNPENPSLGLAPANAEEWANKARIEFLSHNDRTSGEYLGYASHFLIDVGQPLHTGKELELINNPFPHDEYENWTSYNWKSGANFLSNVNNEWDLYAVRSPSFSTIQVARYSHGYIDKVFSAFLSTNCDEEGFCHYRPWENDPRVKATLISLTRNIMQVLARNTNGLVEYVKEPSDA